MKMPTIVGIFIFSSRENFMLSWVKHEIFFITLGPKDTFSHDAAHIDIFWRSQKTIFHYLILDPSLCPDIISGIIV